MGISNVEKEEIYDESRIQVLTPVVVLIFIVKIFVFLFIFLQAVKAELLAGRAAVVTEALPAYLAPVDGLRLHAADVALRHTITSLLRPWRLRDRVLGPFRGISEPLRPNDMQFVSFILKFY